MKFKLFAISLVVMIGGLVSTAYIPDFSIPGMDETAPCEKPLTYRIGEIDERYNFSKNELASVMKKVEALWSTALDRELLAYDESGQVVIKLVYGEEQQLSEQEKTFSQRINVKKKQREVLENEFDRMTRNFKSKREDVEKMQDQYDQEVAKFNNYVSEWNGKSDVPERVVNNIKEMERKLRREKAKLQQKHREVESYRQRTNAKADQLNRVIKEEKEMIASYNNRFAKARKFNQGQYVKKGKNETVFIYQFSNKNDLKTVLAHEFGHAMGLDHVKNPESIMFEMMDQQNIFNLSLTKEDISAIASQCE